MATAKKSAETAAVETVPDVPVRDIGAEQDRVLAVLRRAVEGIESAIVAVETRDDSQIFNAAMTFKMAVAEFPSLYSLIRSSRTSYATGRPVK